MEFSRYLTEKTFAKELTELRAYSNTVFDNLLESLEREGLVVPRLRVRFPDEIARRLWQEDHPDYVVKLPMEGDTERLAAVVALLTAMRRWRSVTVYGPASHPLDDPSDAIAPFVQNPSALPFEPWQSRRVDVSNNHHAELYDYRAHETYYSTWQVLLAAEVADAGIHIRVDLSNPAVVKAVHKALREERLPPSGYNVELSAARVTKGFREHANTLEAIIWFSEDADRAFTYLLRNVSGGRFRLTEEQMLGRGLSRMKAAKDAVVRYQITPTDLIGLLQFLSGRWQHWDREGRPLIVGAYKELMTEVVRLAQRAFDMSFQSISQQVGHPGGWHEPILDKVWPDWKVEQQERVRRTLRSVIGLHGITPDELNAFVDYLSANNLEAFYWRLKSFEDHAFRGNDYAIEGMQADLQGMAVAVEHIVEALGGTETQLYAKFKQLWHEPTVLALLKRNDVTAMARQAGLAQDWPALMASIESLRQEPGGAIAADLVMAHRIRGGVHKMLPEDDQFQLEALLVALMRAAVMTFTEVKRHDAAIAVLPAPA